MNKLNIAILSTSILIYGISLFQNCFCTSNCVNSFFAVLFGFLLTSSGIANLCWLANPLVFASWIFFYKNTKTSFTLSMLASALSLMFIFTTEVVVNEGGSPSQIKRLEIGYWLWLLSIFIISIANSVRYYLEYSINKKL